MAPTVDLTAHRPPARIPKLRYRNPLPSDGQSSLSSHLSQHTGSVSTSVLDRSTTPGSNPASSRSRPSFDTASLSSPSLASTLSSTASSDASRSSRKKKKAGSVLSFLSLKEPSQSALDQFADQQCKQAADKKGSIAAPFRSTGNYANQKLPPHVPKVNSKWDGVPDLKKNRSSTASASSKDNRSSVISRGTFATHLRGITWNESRLTVMTDGTRNPPNSMISSALSTSNLPGGDGARTWSPSTTALPEISYYFPDAGEQSEKLPFMTTVERRSSTELAPRLSDSTACTESSIDESLDFRPDSPASSTYSINTAIRDAADNIFRKLNDQPQQNPCKEDARALQSPEEDGVPDSHNFLFSDQPIIETGKNDSPVAESPIVSSPAAPTAVPHYAPVHPVLNSNRSNSSGSRPPTFRSSSMPSYRRIPSASALPTLYEVSLASSTESLGTVRDYDNSNGEGDTHSIAPSTVAPSELSKHWYESPRERLGLGGRLKMNDISPWNSQEETRAPRVLRPRSAEI
ncbi:hypothetical protein LEMA_P028540.1 [Plenodomus lingam JN3]|uniref:Ca2+-modulated nonselective cation channel polycystin n=1 Tax=Leptosphaeria maculans (strain JN3 / isolate v23.1.3 / race Av1-4-5-6-7-8) TaxID=985895 RepID=E4ZVS6_LEPMJ|nr:hypothetical protein LEMA_P028540.1 [Plenodomus lingam JN3]CBX95702.1 hypothetical protein LEMA_P028540.1 [Plenodomus lingam JN3]